MGAAGLILSGPTLHMWYGLMARWRPGTDALSIAQKMLAGTIFYGPAFNAAFFSANGALQGMVDCSKMQCSTVQYRMVQCVPP